MTASQRADSLPLSPAPASAPAARRAPYATPRLEALGAWRALTLQQTIPIGPGGFLLGPTTGGFRALD
jgi:hypothetical protein